MLSLLGSLLGFGSAFLPKIMDYFQDKQDKAHELEMIAAQVEAQMKLADIKLAATHIASESQEVIAAHREQAGAIRHGAKWLANLSGSVRPIVTYLFVFEFLVINAGIATLFLIDGGFTIATLQQILDDRFFVLLATMLSFWFGNRTFGKRLT